MKVHCIVVGSLASNCYLIEKNHEYLLVDPGDDIDLVMKFIHHKNIIGILVTHHHLDHGGALSYLVNKLHYPVYQYNSLKEGNMKIGNFDIEVIFVPGHTEDSVCYYFKNEKVMFTGDFLFKESIGRCDFLDSSVTKMYHSLKKISRYDDATIIYPGHGDSSSIGYEKVNNMYLREVL